MDAETASLMYASQTQFHRDLIDDNELEQ